MDQSTFFRHMLREVNLKLPGGYSAHYKKVNKNNNVSYTGMYLSAFGEAVVSPLLYMEPVYDKYEAGESWETLAEDIAGILMKPRQGVEEISSLLNPDYARTHIVYRLVGTAANAELLKGTASRPFLDMSIVYALYVRNLTIGTGMTQVTSEMLRRWEISEEELHQLAEVNTPVLLPEKWLSLGEAADQTDSTPADAFYVLSNEESFYGAAAILYSKHLSETAGKLGKDLLVLPTSVHEMIVIPEGEQPIGILTQLFRELLVSESRPEDVLSRSIYRLDHVTGEFSIAAHSD